MNYRLSSLFNEKKAAQVAAFFLLKAEKRRANISLLKLMKLMYLSERKSYELYAEPMIGDRLVCMPHGPVLSNTLNLINFGAKKKVKGGWDELIADKQDRYIDLNPQTLIKSADDLRELSESDLEILESIWASYGKESAQTLRNLTHTKEVCPEWEDPDGSSIPISFDKLFDALGFSKEESEFHIAQIHQRAFVASAFSEPKQ